MRVLTFIRSALYLFILVVTVIPWSFVVCGAVVAPVPVRYRLAQCWTRFAIDAGAVICGMRFRIVGWDNLPDAPAIVLPKHQSAWETLWLHAFLPHQVSFVYKRELHWLPFLGWSLAALDMISIDRAKGGDAFEQVVAQGTDRLNRGWWILIFPEGTRTPPGSTRRYKTGGVRLATRTGAQIVPIAHNAGELWPRQSFLKSPGVITVSILPPISPSDRSTEEVAALVESSIETEMRRLAPHRYAGPYEPAQTQQAANNA